MTQTLEHQRSRSMRAVELLVGSYVSLSMITMAAIVLLRDNPTAVTEGAWIRGTAVAISSLFTLLFVRQMARGNRRAFLRLRIVSTVMLAAVVVIVALPGVLPPWLRIEQAACGLLLLPIAILLNGRRMRSAYAGP